MPQFEAEDLLKRDLVRVEGQVGGLVTMSLTDNQFSTLVSFTYNYNVGLGNVALSALLRKLNAGAAEQFPCWVKCIKVDVTSRAVKYKETLTDLVTRRQPEEGNPESFLRGEGRTFLRKKFSRIL